MPTREEMQTLTQGIISSYEARVAGIASIREATQDQLSELDTAHQDMARQLQARLAKAEGERKRTATQEISQRKADVSTMLNGFDDVHAAMSQGLKADLAKVAPALREAEGERKRTATQEISQRKADVSTMLRGFHKEQVGVRDEWQKLAAAMQSKRGVPAAGKKAAAEVVPEFGDLRDKVFAYLADHPDGARMTQLEKEFGVARIQMARLIRHMTDENKVAKRDLIYFAI